MISVIVCVIIAAAVTLVLWVIAPLDEHPGAHCATGPRKPGPQPSAAPAVPVPFAQAEPAEDNPPMTRDECFGEPLVVGAAPAPVDTPSSGGGEPLHTRADGYIGPRKLMRDTSIVHVRAADHGTWPVTPTTDKPPWAIETRGMPVLALTPDGHCEATEP